MSDLDALMIYGSRARGDAIAASDVDLLGVSAEHRAPTALAQVNLHVYSWNDLEMMVSAHDLFVLHLKWDGRILFETDRRLSELLGRASARHAYAEERLSATRVLRLLHAADADTLPRRSLDRVALWAIRTFAFSIAVERGITTFARDVVLDEFSDGLLEQLWPARDRRREWRALDYKSTLATFLEEWTSTRIDQGPAVTVQQVLAEAVANSDRVAVKQIERAVSGLTDRLAEADLEYSIRTESVPSMLC